MAKGPPLSVGVNLTAAAMQAGQRFEGVVVPTSLQRGLPGL